MTKARALAELGDPIDVDMTKLLAVPLTELDVEVQSETSSGFIHRGSKKDSTAFLEHVAEQW